MGDNIPRRQHYIPVMLLENFCDANGRVWVGRDGKTFPTNPNNVFAKRDLNTIFNLGSAPNVKDFEERFRSAERNDEYETNVLNQIESKAKPAISRIIDQARLSRCPELTPELDDAWKQFAITQARRTPESQERVSADVRFDDAWYEAAARAADKQNYPLPDKATLYQDPHVRRLVEMSRSNIDARFAAGDHPNEREQSEKFSRETGLCVAVIRMPDRGFIVGSHGITIVESDDEVGPVKGSWLPIAYDVAVQVTAHPDRETLVILDNNDGHRVITMINRASVARSRMIAGRSETLVRSLVQAKEGRR